MNANPTSPPARVRRPTRRRLACAVAILLALLFDGRRVTIAGPAPADPARRAARYERARALLGAADSERLHGNAASAARAASMAQATFISLSDPVGVADALATIAMIETSIGDLRAAGDHYGEALDYYEASQRDDGAVNALRGLAEVARLSGRLELAMRLLDDALLRLASSRYRLGEANVRLSLGSVLLDAGRLDDARGQFGRAIRIYATELHDRIGEATATLRGGDVADAAGDRPAAVASYERARGLFHADNDPLGEGSATLRLASVADSRTAPALFEQAAVLFARAGLARWSAEAREHSRGR